MKKEIRFYLSAQDLSRTFKEFEIEGRNGAGDFKKFVEYLDGLDLADSETEVTADNIADLAELMESTSYITADVAFIVWKLNICFKRCRPRLHCEC